MSRMTDASNVDPNVDQNVDPINLIRDRVDAEVSAHGKRPITERLFGNKLAVGGYQTILKNDKKLPKELVLQALYEEARKLVTYAQFNFGTTLHQDIKKIAGDELKDLEKEQDKSQRHAK